MNIQQMAGRLNLTSRAIRFYEEKGLLKPQRQQHNQYRLYTEADAWRLQTIGALRELGIPLDEIKRLIQDLEAGDADEFRAYLNVQRSYLFQRWTEMKQLLAGLDTLIEKSAGDDGLVLEDLFLLADQEKRMKAAREEWKDLWDYNALAGQYDERRSEIVGYPATASEYDHVLGETAAAVNPKQGEKGLDLGTGTGNLAGRLIAMGAQMAGVDQSPEMLRRSKAKHPSLETKLGNLMAVPYFDASFDFVVSSFALQHLTEEQKRLALAETSRVLRSHGRIVFADKMFTDEEHRTTCMEGWERNGNVELLHAAAKKHYADRSALLGWFRLHDYVAYAQPLDDELLHLVVAIKRS